MKQGLDMSIWQLITFFCSPRNLIKTTAEWKSALKLTYNSSINIILDSKNKISRNRGSDDLAKRFDKKLEGFSLKNIEKKEWEKERERERERENYLKYYQIVREGGLRWKFTSW